MTRGVVFDIDDTLYLERDYVRSGFAHVARELGRSGPEADRLERWLLDAFESGVRGDTFDRLLSTFPDIEPQPTVAGVVASYRAHVPSIALSPGVSDVLDALTRRRLRLGVLSDGPGISQAAKAAALGLERWFDPVLLTDAFGEAFAKPSTRGFEAIGQAWGLPPDVLAYVADNPEKDFEGPRRLGWQTIRVRQAGQLQALVEPARDAARPDVEVPGIGLVRDVLR